MPIQRPPLNIIGILEKFHPLSRTGTIGGQQISFVHGLNLSGIKNKYVLRARIVQSGCTVNKIRWKVDRFQIMENHDHR